MAFGGATIALVGAHTADQAASPSSASTPTPAPVSASAPPAGAPSPAAPAPDGQPEAWRQLFYDTAAANLRHGEMEARELYLYYTEQGPLMSMSYGVLQREQVPNSPDSYSLYARVYKAWRIEEGQAVLQLEVDSGADRFSEEPQPDASTVWLGTNAESGSMILLQQLLIHLFLIYHEAHMPLVCDG